MPSTVTTAWHRSGSCSLRSRVYELAAAGAAARLAARARARARDRRLGADRPPRLGAPLQQAFLHLPALVDAMNVFYLAGHFLAHRRSSSVWLYRRSRAGFRLFRNGFLLATALALVDRLALPDRPAAARRASASSTRCDGSRESTSARPARRPFRPGRRRPLAPCRLGDRRRRSASRSTRGRSPEAGRRRSTRSPSR